MKRTPHPQMTRVLTCLLIVLSVIFSLVQNPVHAAVVKTWDGGGADTKWQTGANWVGDAPPAAGDFLVFTTTVGLVSSNNFSAGTAFGSITFQPPAGAFVLTNSAITLNGGITNNQTVTIQTINLPITLGVTPSVSVANNAALTINGPISGGFGLTKNGGGLLTLGAANTFSGNLTVNNGTVQISSDSNLGTVPGGATPGKIALNGGALQTRTTGNVTINANRGIAVGPSPGTFDIGTVASGNGVGIIYNGIIAGSGGVIKRSFGSLTLGGPNTYSGSTAIRNGSIVLDFNSASAPANNIINSASALSLGGDVSGAGVTNWAALIANPKASVNSTQQFVSTFIDRGQAFIRGNTAVGGSMTIRLGALSHTNGGFINFIPPTLLGGAGAIHTGSSNINEILGGWATIGPGVNLGGRSPSAPTNFATVDATGNIVNYTNYTVYSAGLLKDIMWGTNNILVPNAASPADIVMDADGAATLYDVNAIKFERNTAWTLHIGSNNTLRLGRFGGLFNYLTGAGTTWVVGGGALGSNGAYPQDSAGNLTAGGAPNTPGELVIINTTTGSGSGNNWNIDASIRDNGTGPVTVVKAGSGFVKFRNHNPYSGGTYLLQGRLQIEDNLASGTPVSDVFGSGDVFIFPGGNLFGGTSGGAPLPNRFFVGGASTQQEPQIGAIRTGGSLIITNDVILIGDTTIGGNGGFGGRIQGKISGPFILSLGSAGTVSGAVSISNPSNDWTGDTIIQGRVFAGAGNNTFISGDSEIIPHGFGRGNVILNGISGSQGFWTLNGTTETINGLSSIGTALQVSISNHVGTALLRVGENDQSGTYSGTITDNGTAPLSLVKIGGGALTLAGLSTYNGSTRVEGGTLAMSGTGAIVNSAIHVSTNATLDASAVTGGFTTTKAVEFDKGTLVVGSSTPNLTSVSVTNAGLTAVISPTRTNLIAGTLTAAGTTLLNVVSVQDIAAYPTTFPIIKYTTFNSNGFFALGTVPSPATTGFFSNDVVNSQIVLVLTDGPKPLTWVGNVNADWDVATTTNWLAFGTAPSTFNPADSVLFDNSSVAKTVRIPADVSPAAITVDSTANYIFHGAGAIVDFAGLTKNGSGSLTFLNTGGDTYKGGIEVNAGTVTFGTDNGITGGGSIAVGAVVNVGTNGPTGSLPGGALVNDGTINFNRTTDLTVGSAIGGIGGLNKNLASVLTLSGNNTFTGAVSVAAGTLRAGSGTALGATNSGTTIASGSTLDVNGQILGFEPVSVSGTGVGGAGVIVNSGADQLNALRHVTLTSDVTFGGAARWDIRGTSAGAADAVFNANGFDITKIGTNQVSLVHVGADPQISDIIVKEGLFAVETTTLLGIPTDTITVSNGATFQMFSHTLPVTKNFDLRGDGLANTFNFAGSGVSGLGGNIQVTGNVIVNHAGGSLSTVSAGWTGGANVRMQGTGTNVLSGTVAYTGTTTISNSTVYYTGSKSGAGITVWGGIIGGTATIGENVTVNGGGIRPGFNSAQALGITGSLTLDGADMVFDLDTTAAGLNDQINVSSTLSLSNTNTIRIVPTTFLGEAVIYTLITYSGALPSAITNNLSLVQVPGYAISIVDPGTTPGNIRIRIDQAIKNLRWIGTAGPTWDVGTTVNWDKDLSGVANSVFTNLDIVNFDNFNENTNVTLVGTLIASQINFNNFFYPMNLSGSGKMSGPAGMRFEGAANVVINNSGSNDFTGQVLLNQSVVEVKNGGLGSGPLLMTNFSAFQTPELILDTASTLFINNSMSGTNGHIKKLGSGTAYLNGASTFIGQILVSNGTLAAGADTALGATNETVVLSGATLDVNARNLGSERVIVSGAGVGNNGAIVNNATNAQTQALRFVTLTGNTTFGGMSRWDIRGAPARLDIDPPGNPTDIVKTGTNVVALVAVASVDSGVRDIDIQQGHFGVHTSGAGATAQLGDPNGVITIRSGASLGLFNQGTVPLDKVIVAESGSVLTNESGDSIIVGDITLNGLATIVVAGNSLTMQSNTIAGAPTNITKGGNGSLILVGNALPSVNTLVMGGGSLDLTTASSSTIALGSSQVLRGQGYIVGTVNANVGSTVDVGLAATNTGTLAANTLTLAGLTLMDLNATTGTNDVITATNLSYGGTLTVSVGTGTLVAGQSYKLFSSPGDVYGGAFTTVNLPTPPGGSTWVNTLTTDGRITLTGAPATPNKAHITSVARIATPAPFGSVVMSGTNGLASGTYYLVTSTNITTPLTNWVRVLTNNFDGSGNFTLTNAVDPTKPRQFYNIAQPNP